MKIDSICFIGLGNMGLPMATNLATANFQVRGFDPQVTNDDTADIKNISVFSTLSEALSGADLVVTMLPIGKVVLDILQIVVKMETPPTAVVDCSTIDINDARKAHELAASANIGFLDSPVSGGTTGALAGTLTAMVGGSENLLTQLKPALEPMFSRFAYCGTGGSGQAAKICNNLLLATTMIGTGEAFNLGQRLGLDMQTLFNVLSTSTGSCWSVNNYCPVPGVGPDSPANHDYTPGFTAQMMLKDMNLAQEAAMSVGQATPLGERALALYEDYAKKGGGTEDFSGIIRYLEKMDR